MGFLKRCEKSLRRCGLAAFLLIALAVVCPGAWAQGPEDEVCPRPRFGSAVQPPPEIRSQNRRLELTLRFRISADAHGLTRFCYLSDGGLQAPTLRVNPGDELIIHFRNELPGSPSGQPSHSMAHGSEPCASGRMSLAATNLHFHGLGVPPTCHQDDVMHTLIEPETTFDYRLKIPANTPPGLYWYHPHAHPFTEAQVQGGASGALIVEGMSSIWPEVSELPERVLILRDQRLPAGVASAATPNLPGWDISVNFVPVPYPEYVPAIIQTSPRQREFWRVLNAAADTIFDLQVLVHNTPQSLRLLAIDGVPISAGASGSPAAQGDVLLPPGSRAEFVVNTPNVGEPAQLITRAWNTGPDGDNDPKRAIANIVSIAAPPLHEHSSSAAAASGRSVFRSPSLRNATPVAQRKLYFSEKRNDPKNFGSTSFFLTVEGRTPAMFKMNAPPDIVARQGTVEDWIIENRAREEHVFHIHQIHFQVLEVDGKPVNDPALRDTIDLPYWKGYGPYPSVKLRMDFRDPNIIGTFMYHCHILQHSDNGMMGSIQVLPAHEALGTPAEQERQVPRSW
jgi:FtsP/CotA-like multicopper oxidase with cupredoxin domain